MDLRRRGLLCLLTDRRRLQAASEAEALSRLVDLAGAAGAAGVDLIQIRERDLDAAVLGRLVTRCLRAVEGTQTRILINDRVDVAMATSAHGVHLRSDSYRASRARSLLGPDAIIGQSLHTQDEASALAGDDDIDYLIFGTLFETISKDEGHRRSTLQELSAVCAAARMPVLGIGGMSLPRAIEVARHGGAGVAAIGLFLPPAGVPSGEYLAGTVKTLREAFDSGKAVS